MKTNGGPKADARQARVTATSGLPSPSPPIRQPPRPTLEEGMQALRHTGSLLARLLLALLAVLQPCTFHPHQRPRLTRDQTRSSSHPLSLIAYHSPLSPLIYQPDSHRRLTPPSWLHEWPTCNPPCIPASSPPSSLQAACIVSRARRSWPLFLDTGDLLRTEYCILNPQL